LRPIRRPGRAGAESNHLPRGATERRNQPDSTFRLGIVSDGGSVGRPGGLQILGAVVCELHDASAASQLLQINLERSGLIRGVSDGVSVVRKRGIDVEPGGIRNLQRAILLDRFGSSRKQTGAEKGDGDEERHEKKRGPGPTGGHRRVAQLRRRGIRAKGSRAAGFRFSAPLMRIRAEFRNRCNEAVTPGRHGLNVFRFALGIAQYSSQQRNSASQSVFRDKGVAPDAREKLFLLDEAARPF
jgi:hypothetical protein